MDGSQSVNYSVKVSDKVDKQIKKMCLDEGMTKSEFLRTAIREFLKKKE